MKTHPRFASPAVRGGGPGEGECFLFSPAAHRASCYGGPGLASGSQGSPAHLRETSSGRKRSSHQSLTHPPEPGWTILSGGPHYLGLFLVSPLGSLDWPLSFTRSKLTRENASADPQRLARTKSPDAATTPLSRGQEDSAAGETVGKTTVAPSCPQSPTIPRPPALPEGQPEAADRRV